jgi:hypothetical protein
MMDGDGCFDLLVSKEKYIRPRVRLKLTEPGYEVLECCYNSYKGFLSKEYRKGNSNWLGFKEWAIYGKRSRGFLQHIVNYSVIKKEQIKLLIYIIDNLMGKHISNEIRAFIVEELKAMKRDSQRLSEKAIVEIEQLML